jgi:outer membrane protein TolC
MICRRCLSALLALLLHAGSAWAQATEPPREPLTLAALQRQAANLDPRTQQIPLYDREADLHTANINAERRPAVSVSSRAQYQSDIPQFPFASIAGTVGLPFGPPKDTYDASARVDQRLFDATIAPRLALEQAQSAESQARVRATLFSLRQQVNEAFFTAALFQSRSQALGAAASDLQMRLAEMNARVREGAALVADAAAIEATLLQRRQEQAETAANRHAALARLSSLTGQPIGDDAVLAMPVLAADVATARDRLRSLRERPEYAVFDRSRQRLSRQEDVAAVQNSPRVNAYGTGGLGRPGLNYVSHQWEWYWLGGVQMEWRAWDWGARDRDREALAVERQIVAADEAAFTADIERAVQIDLATIDRLRGTLAADDRIIELRETIDRGTHARFRENVITAADYLDRSTELLDARFNRAAHEIELAQASAHFLNTLGIEVP